MSNKIPKGWLIYFVVLSSITIGQCIVLFPATLTEYQGGQINKLGLVVWFIIMIFALLFTIFQFGSLIISLFKKKYRVVSLALFVLSALSFSWASILNVILPYEVFMISDARKIVNTQEFSALEQLYSSEGKAISFSVLPENDYFVIGDYVIDFNSHTFGPLQKGFGFFAEYYESAKAHSFSDTDSLVRALPSHLEPGAVKTMYSLMCQIGLSDVYVDTIIHGRIFAFVQSAGAGSRGILIDSTSTQATILQSLGKNSKVEQLKLLSPGIYYYRTASYQPF